MTKKPTRDKVRTPPYPDRTAHADGWTDYERLLADLGTATRPKLTTCVVCGHRMYGDAPAAHSTCGNAVGLPSPAPAAPAAMPVPLVGSNVYTAILAARDEDRVTDAQAAQWEADARAKIRRAPRCGTCQRPMLMGQRGTHYGCRGTDQTTTNTMDTGE